VIPRRELLSSLAGAALFGQARRERPNVLLLIADDMNNAIGCFGHPVAQTPNIARLARRGIASTASTASSRSADRAVRRF
jgi:arylsulfatase A-like enzyme